MNSEQKKAHDRLGKTLNCHRYTNRDKDPTNHIPFLQGVIKCKVCGDQKPRNFYEGDKTTCKKCKIAHLDKYEFGKWD